MRGLQQITTPFNSIFTIRDPSVAVSSGEYVGDSVKVKASRESSSFLARNEGLARNGGRKQGGLVCRPKDSKKYDACLPRAIVSERGHTLFSTSLRVEIEHV